MKNAAIALTLVACLAITACEKDPPPAPSPPPQNTEAAPSATTETSDEMTDDAARDSGHEGTY